MLLTRLDVPLNRMFVQGAKVFRHQHGEICTEHFRDTVSEYLLCGAVDRKDRALVIDHDYCIGGRLENRSIPILLLFEYFFGPASLRNIPGDAQRADDLSLFQLS